MTSDKNYDQCMSKALKILSANIDSLVGPGRRFANDGDLGEATKLGQRTIHRIRTQEVEPKIDKLDALAGGIGVTIPALFSPDLNPLQGAAEGAVGELIERLYRLARRGVLEDRDIETIASVISMAERSHAAIDLPADKPHRITGT
jgi:transcriptional regulator with XRE-family HTH domain